MVHGCVRDSDELAKLPLGVYALNTNPRKTDRKAEGLVDVEVKFAGISIRPHDYIVVDEDGMVKFDQQLRAKL